MINNKLFIPASNGVRILHYEENNKVLSSSVRQFLPTPHFDYDDILGLNKPKNRVKALTYVWNSTQNCHVVRTPKFGI